MTIQHQISIRVRYNETDGQGRVHHAQYLNYFERGRIELMRTMGRSYRDFEADGLMLVVAEMNVKYLGAALFDDLLLLTTMVTRARGVRIEHTYEVVRTTENDPEQAVEPIATAKSMIACVDRSGKVRPLPDYLRDSRPSLASRTEGKHASVHDAG